jgi:predicted short-subunit dehydrogenase-like oxidoreductase (DUF2520 family)
MKLVLIGSGNTASVLARKFVTAGHTILQIWSRNRQHAEVLAGLTHAAVLDSLHTITPEADLVVIAVSDQAIPAIASQLQLQQQPVVHTAGAVSRNVLQNCSAQYGVLYPLQSLRKEQDPATAIPFLVDASSPRLLTQLKAIAGSISSLVQEASDEQRLHLHLAAVVVNNFTNHLYELAYRYCRNQQVDFQLLIPLAVETALRLGNTSPGLLQTGPASRNDTITIQRHLMLLEKNPELQHLYENLSNHILAMYHKKEELRSTNSPI